MSGAVGAIGNFALGFVSGFIQGFTSTVLASTAGKFAVGLATLQFGGGIEGILTTLGVPPKVAHYINLGLNIAGAIATGNPALIASVLASTAVTEFGPRLGLSPELTAILSFTVGALGGAVGGAVFDPKVTAGQALKTALKNIAPDVVGALGKIGVKELGKSIGLDPRLTALLSAASGAILGNLTDGIVNAKPGEGIFNSVKDTFFSKSTLQEVLGGALDVGVQVASDKLGISPLVGAVAVKGITGAISGFVTDDPEGGGAISRMVKGAIGGLAETGEKLIRSTVQDPVRLGALLGSGASLGEILERRATALLTQSSLEDLVKTHGSLKTAYDDAKKRERTFERNGKVIQELELKGTQSQTFIEVDKASGKVLRVQSKDRILQGDKEDDIAFRPDGTAYVINGTVTEKTAEGIINFTVYEKGQVLQMQVVGNKTHIDIQGMNGKPVSFYSDGSLKEGVIENFTAGKRTVVTQDKIRTEVFSVTAQAFQGGKEISYKFYSKQGDGVYQVFDRKTGVNLEDGVVRSSGGGKVILEKTPANAPPLPGSGAGDDAIADLSLEELSKILGNTLDRKLPSGTQGLNDRLVGKLKENEALIEKAAQQGKTADQFINILKDEARRKGASQTDIDERDLKIQNGINTAERLRVAVPDINVNLFTYKSKVVQGGEEKTIKVKSDLKFDNGGGNTPLIPGAPSKTTIKIGGENLLEVNSTSEFEQSPLGAINNLLNQLKVPKQFRLPENWKTYEEVGGIVNAKASGPALNAGGKWVSEVKDTKTNEVRYKLESGIQTDLKEKKHQLVMNVKNIRVSDSNPNVTLNFQMTITVGKTKDGDTRERIKSNILDDINKLNEILTGNKILPGGVIPGFREAVEPHVDQLVDQVLAFDKAADIIGKLGTQESRGIEDLSLVENALKSNQIILLP